MKKNNNFIATKYDENGITCFDPRSSTVKVKDSLKSPTAPRAVKNLTII